MIKNIALLLFTLTSSAVFAQAEPPAIPVALPRISAFDDVPWTALPDGRRRKVWFSDKMTFTLWDFTRPEPQVTETPLHSHPHEQITYIISGKGIARVGAIEKPVDEGSVLVVPGNVPHGVKILSDKLVCIDVFTPTREEFRVNVSTK